MSVRHAMLALLSEGPKYGLQLRQEFEERTGEVWPLNVGQVYTTLQRLERDGLVASDGAGEDGPQKGFRITTDGAEELRGWLSTPPDLSAPPRDELVIKVLIALRVPGIDVHQVIQAHRRYLVELMQEWTRLKEYAADRDLGFALAWTPSCSGWRQSSGGSTRRKVVSSGPPSTGPRAQRRACRSCRGRWRCADEDAGASGGMEGVRRRADGGRGDPRRFAVGRRGRAGSGDGTERVGKEHPSDHRRQP